MSKYSAIVDTLRKGFEEGLLKDIDSRKNAIRAILKLINENSDEIAAASAKDSGRPEFETKVIDICGLKREANFVLAHMDSWLKDEYVSRSFISMMDTIYVQRQPLGVVIIFGPWNYPFLMALQPLIGAIAAGNTVALKPSEYTTTSTELMKRLIPKYLNEKICQVICADAKESAELLDSVHFDHIFFTGGPKAGRSVYAAAAKQLTPITLELGGKNPSYVDSNVDMMMAVRRIIWSKVLNCGQACLATDYIICHQSSLEGFRTTVVNVLREFLGEDPKKSPDFTRIVNKMHWERLTGLLSKSKGKILCGGESDSNELYIAPTVVGDVTLEDSLMSEEIFGPILPIITVKSASEAVDVIRKSGSPLAVYVFTNDVKVFEVFKQNTTSGALLQNICFMHFPESNLPFGGVGPSGIGRYHGKYSVENFSNHRAIMLKSKVETWHHKAFYPPYNNSKLGNAEKLLSYNERGACSIQ